jgi:pyruvate carboxylase
MGIRVDAASTYPGSVITPHYDSLLCKVTGHSRSYTGVIAKLSRSLKVF